jgi:hypothetical protein
MDRIIFQQKGSCLDIGKIIHGNDFNIGPGGFLKGAQHIAANAAKSIDTNSQSHNKFSPPATVNCRGLKPKSSPHQFVN